MAVGLGRVGTPCRGLPRQEAQALLSPTRQGRDEVSLLRCRGPCGTIRHAGRAGQRGVRAAKLMVCLAVDCKRLQPSARCST